MSNGGWDHVALRTYVIAAAQKSGVANRQSELARATGLDEGLISRWFRGKVQPSVENLQKLASVIPAARLDDMMVLAGRRILHDLDASPPPRIHDQLALDVDALVSPDSPLPEAEREYVRKGLEHFLERYRDVLDQLDQRRTA